MNGCGRIFSTERAFDLHFVNKWDCGDVPNMIHKGGKFKGQPLFRQLHRRGGIVWARNVPDFVENVRGK
jgi:hypothetical protein